MFPILRDYTKATAAGFLGTRIFEGLVLALGVVSLVVLTGSDAIGANAAFYNVAEAGLGIGSLVFCALLFRTGLVPRWLAAWGLIGYACFAAGNLLELFGVAGAALVASIPGGLLEWTFAIWLISCGSPSPRPPLARRHLNVARRLPRRCTRGWDGQRGSRRDRADTQRKTHPTCGGLARLAADRRARVGRFGCGPSVGDMGSGRMSEQMTSSDDDIRGSFTAVADSASAALRRVRGNDGLLLLELDVTRDLAEAPVTSPLAVLRGLRALSLKEVIRALEKSADDDEVAGLVAHIGGEIGFSQVAELRAAVGRFRSSGKRTAAYAETFGEMGPGNSSYHLASAFEEIWLQPTGDLGLVGLAATAVFVRGSLDKLGVQTQIGHRHEYKTAPNTFLETDLTPAHREMMESLVGSITDEIIHDIAAARGLTDAAVREAVSRAPLTAQDAFDGGFVDRVGYRDELYRMLREELTERQAEPRLRFVDHYGKPGSPLARLAAGVQHVPQTVRRRDVIAVVGAHGPIHLGRSGSPGPLSGPSAGADTVTAALRSAGRDDHVRAIVLRIDSPGGSAVASDAIRRAVLEVRSSGTPVVASMASLAASGGYFIAMPCDRVLATPSSLTGSIGVWGGKQVISDGLARIGITRATVSASRYADMFSTNRPFDEEEWARVDVWLDRVYDDFTEKVAQDRALPLDRVHELARGRVWTGSQAAEHRLIDGLGGLSAAIDTACELGGTDRSKADVRPWPKARLMAMLKTPESSEAPAAAEAASTLPPLGGSDAALDRLLQLLAAEAGLPAYGALAMPWRITLR